MSVKYVISDAVKAEKLSREDVVYAISCKASLDEKTTAKEKTATALVKLAGWDVDDTRRAIYAAEHAEKYGAEKSAEGFKAIKKAMKEDDDRAARALEKAKIEFAAVAANYETILRIIDPANANRENGAEPRLNGEYRGLYALALHNLSTARSMRYLSDGFADDVQAIINTATAAMTSHFENEVTVNQTAWKQARAAQENFLKKFAPEGKLFSTYGKAGHLDVSATACKEFCAGLFTRATTKDDVTKRLFKGAKSAAGLMDDLLYRAIKGLN